MLNKIAVAISFKNRIKKFNLFMLEFHPTQNSNILDIGPNDCESNKTINMFEKLYPYRQKITVLGLYDFDNFRKTYPEIAIIKYDGNKFPIENKQFNFVWSNAVLEHVGNFEKQVEFVKEIKRVSNHAMITTPNRFFPFELHTKIFLLHYFPKKIFDKLLILMNKKWATGDCFYLLSKRKIKKMLRGANIEKYKIVSNRFLGFTIDYCIFL